MSKKSLVAVKWDKPGSVYHGVVHFVSKDLVKDIPGKPGKVHVLWPRKGKKEPELWEGFLVEGKLNNYFMT